MLDPICKTLEYRFQHDTIVDFQTHASAWPFLKPVEKSEAPDYYDHIKFPMGEWELNSAEIIWHKKDAEEWRLKGHIVQCVENLTRNRSVVILNPIRLHYCFLEQEINPHCFVLVGSRKEFKRDFIIELI